MCNIGRTRVLIDELLWFYHRTLLFWCVWRHRRPQTLAEICRNMGICCGFRAVAARDKYPGFILLPCAIPHNLARYMMHHTQTFVISRQHDNG